MRLKDMLAAVVNREWPAAPAAWIWHLDRPVSRPAADTFEVEGWVAGDRACTLAPVRGGFRDFEWMDRPDLRPPPGARAWASGFRFRADAGTLEKGTLAARASGGGAEADLAWTFPDAIDPERKRRKLARIRQELLLPGRTPRETADYLDFLPASAPRAHPTETEASGYQYPEAVNALVAAHEQGWILDCGAGNRPVYFDNVVNLDIVPYAATDVLADAESLPFRDASFDGVVTLAALEHVRRPWVVASELVRVLKPGGTLIADVPFLQPVHAFPHHYFNMTSEALRSLFEDSCDIVRAEVPPYGHPVFTLAWFLQRYAAGLPPEQRDALMQMRVSDLVRTGHEQVGEPHVTQLAEAQRFELASLTTIVARKR